MKRELAKKVRVTRVCLFGSRARGTFNAESDYDIAVISPDFEKLPFIERQLLVRPLVRKALGELIALDVACYTPEEFERGKIGFLPGIIEAEGIAV